MAGELSKMPVDFLKGILKFLRTPQVVLLWFCGDSQLNLRLGPLGGITELDFHDQAWLSTSRWPRIIGNCLGLERLRIIAGFRPLGPLSWIWADLSGLKRLTSIHLQFSEAELCFFEQDIDPSSNDEQTSHDTPSYGHLRDLTSHFPNLKSLKLFASICCISNDDMKRIPPTLKELELNRFYPRFKDLPLGSFPPNLRKVDIYCPLSSFEDLSTRTETLAVHHSIPLHLLPPSVTALEILGKQELGMNITDTHLPDTILSLEITHLVVVPKRIPIFLTKLKLVEVSPRKMGPLLSQLPDTLEHFSIKSCNIFTAQEVSQLPRNLKILDVPLSLESLFVVLGDEKVPTLPPSLLSVEQVMESKMLPYLPKTLLDLKLYSLGMNMDDSEIAQNLALLPPRLTHLNVISFGPGCERHFANLPRTLHRIVAEIPISHESATRWLPEALQRMNFRADAGFLPDLGHLKQMRSVVLTLRNVLITSQYCASLPPRLETISFKGSNVSIEKEALAALPPMVKNLVLGDTIAVPSSHFPFLPRRLKRLSCSGSAITDAEPIKNLPRGLTEFAMTDGQLPLECVPHLPFTIGSLRANGVQQIKQYLDLTFQRIQLLPNTMPDPRLSNPNFMQEVFDDLSQGPHRRGFRDTGRKKTYKAWRQSDTNVL